MDLVIGGAFQGKTQWAMERFGMTEADLFICQPEGTPDFSRRCVAHIENYALACLRRGEDPREALLARRDQWKNTVFLCDDIFCGVVPVPAEERAWRESCGRMVSALAERAGTVTRIFCGLPQRLK